MNKNIKIGIAAATVAVVTASAFMVHHNFTKKEKTSDVEWICTDQYGSLSKDMNISLKDDYNAAINKDFLLDLKLEPGYVGTSLFDTLNKKVIQRKKELIKDPSLTSYDAMLVKTVYSMADDWESRNKLGISPILPYIDAIYNIQNLDELTTYLKDPKQNIKDNILGQITVINDFDNPENYIVSLDALPLCMTDAAEYSKQTEAGKTQKDFLHDGVEYILNRAGYAKKDIDQIFEQSISLETEAAKSMFTSEDTNDPDFYYKVNNKYTRETLGQAYGNYPILEILDGLGYGDSHEFLVAQPKYASTISAMYVPENLEKMKSYLLVQYIKNVLRYLDWDAYEFRNSLYQKYLGSEGIKEKDMIAYDYTENLVPIPLDNLYINRYTTPDEKEKIKDLIDETIDYYREMLKKEDWLSEETKQKAIEKLDSITIHAVYPDTLCDNSDLKLRSKQEGGSFFEAFLTVNQYEKGVNRSKINTKADLKKWDQRVMPVSTANAFYDPQANSINILAGILIDPLYSEDMPREELLGGIGSTIGHEISHAFDTTGAQFDKDGVLKNWWTEEDYNKFMKRSEKLVNYWHQFIPYPGADYYNGELIKGRSNCRFRWLEGNVRYCKNKS